MRRNEPGGRIQGLPREPQVGIEPTTAPLRRLTGSRFSLANRNQERVYRSAGNAQPLLYEGTGPRNRNRNAISVWVAFFRERLLKIQPAIEQPRPAKVVFPLPRGTFRAFGQWLKSERYLRAEARRARRIKTRQLSPRELAEIRRFMRPWGAA
jgi:hypothetical protein